MNKYEVTLYLMVDPTVNDDTFEKVYTVEAENEWKAYLKAGEKQSEDEPNIKYRSVFNYKAKLIK